MGSVRVTARLLRRRLGDEQGLTIVEGVVAAMLLVLGAVGVLQVFDAGTRNTFRAEESQVVNDRLQAELEAIKRLPYEQVALTALPADSGDPGDPRSRMAGAQYATGRDGGGLAGVVYNGALVPGSTRSVSGGQISPAPTEFEAGDVSGRLYRFVTWSSDPACSACGPGGVKRVIVAAVLDDSAISFERPYQEIHSDIVDPSLTPDENRTPDPEDPGSTNAQFWLTDTTCNNSSRQPIAASHLGHNTRGVCSNGQQTGTTRGAPDLMFTSAPSVTDGQATFDYATDSEPAQNAGADIGYLMPATATNCGLASVLNTIDVRRLLGGLISALQISTPGALDGVLDLTGGESSKQHRLHTWVSPPVSGSGGVLLGGGTLDLYTRTINGAVHPGRICAWLSVRQNVTIPTCLVNLIGICVPTAGSPVTIPVDLPFINVGLLLSGECRSGAGLNLTNFTYSRNPWPAEWQKISVPMCFAAVDAAGAVVPAVLPPNSRIVLNLMVHSGGTSPGQGLEFMYDAVGYESKLLLESENVISF